MFLRFYVNSVDEEFGVGGLLVLRFKRVASRVQRSMIVFLLDRAPLLFRRPLRAAHRLQHLPLLHPSLLLLAKSSQKPGQRGSRRGLQHFQHDAVDSALCVEPPNGPTVQRGELRDLQTHRSLLLRLQRAPERLQRADAVPVGLDQHVRLEVIVLHAKQRLRVHVPVRVLRFHGFYDSTPAAKFSEPM